MDEDKLKWLEEIDERVARLERAFESRHGHHSKLYDGKVIELDPKLVRQSQIKGRGTYFFVSKGFYGFFYIGREVMLDGGLYVVTGIDHAKGGWGLLVKFIKGNLGGA